MKSARFEILTQGGVFFQYPELPIYDVHVLIDSVGALVPDSIGVEIRKARVEAYNENEAKDKALTFMRTQFPKCKSLEVTKVERMV